jgi:drug/metabolite transporter (DMT)-like permease
MWIRGIIGILLVVAGVVFILQGANVLHGSMMSGHGGYAVLGAVVLLIGAALLVWTWRRRGTAGG